MKLKEVRSLLAKTSLTRSKIDKKIQFKKLHIHHL